MPQEKKNRFIIEEGDIRIIGRHEPTEMDRQEADELFDKILTKKKPKSKKTFSERENEK